MLEFFARNKASSRTFELEEMPSSLLKEPGHHGAFFVRVTLKGQSLQRDRHGRADGSKPAQDIPPTPVVHSLLGSGRGKVQSSDP